jgi:hypothetical protein
MPEHALVGLIDARFLCRSERRRRRTIAAILLIASFKKSPVDFWTCSALNSQELLYEGFPFALSLAT